MRSSPLWLPFHIGVSIVFGNLLILRNFVQIHQTSKHAPAIKPSLSAKIKSLHEQLGRERYSLYGCFSLVEVRQIKCLYCHSMARQNDVIWILEQLFQRDTNAVDVFFNFPILIGINNFMSTPLQSAPKRDWFRTDYAKGFFDNSLPMKNQTSTP